MLLISSELLFLCTATIVLFPGCWRTADAMKFTSSPGDQVVVIGFNSSVVRLRWTVDLEEASFGRLKITLSPSKNFVDIIALYSSSPLTISAGYEDRVNVTLAHEVDNGTVKVDFVIQNVTNSDEFYYKVWVEDTNINEKQNTIFIDVKVAAHNVTTVCGQANLDEAMTCNCTADSDLEFTSFQWRAPNDTVLHNGSSFTTARVEASLDGKHYTCVASSSFGQEARGRTTPFNVLYPPSRAVIMAEPNATVIAGETLTLICNADGNPAPEKFEWKRNGAEIQNNSAHRVLVISVATSTTNGTYSCKATNFLGSATGWKNITVKPNECTTDSCNGNGLCTVVKGVATCDCNEYWRDSDCGVSRCRFDDYCENKVKQGNLESVTGRITLMADYPPEFANKKSTEFVEFSAKVLLSLAKAAEAKAGSITDLKPGSVIVEFVLYYEKGTAKEEMENRVRDAFKGGKLGNYSVDKESLRFPEAIKPTQNPDGNKAIKPTQNPDDNTMTIIVIVVVIVVVLVTVIVAIAVWRFKKKRGRKDIKASAVANGEDHRMEEIPLSEPSVEAGKGPTDAKVTNKKKPGKKTDYLCTDVDVSKKSKKKKKKPEEIMYADLADFEPEAAAQSAQPGAGKQPIKKPKQHQGTDYASITDLLKKGEGGEAEKVSIGGPATGSEPPVRPKGEKPI